MSHSWEESAAAWIADMGDQGDYSRRVVLDPHLDSLLGNVSGLSVLDVGCGEGRYCRILRAKGALPVGLDPTEALLQHAQIRDPEGDYRLGRGEELPFSDGTFDLVVNYLSLVDTERFREAICEMARVCRPEGRVLLVNISNFSSPRPDWVRGESGEKLYRAVDRYMEEFATPIEWRNIRIVNYHRPLSAIMSAFLETGLVLTSFTEPLPPATDPYYDQYRRAPYFQVMLWRKPA